MSFFLSSPVETPFSRLVTQYMLVGFGLYSSL
jgi:hypothetical protein